MASRHTRNDDETRSNIKECRGGLRDIEMLLLMYETKHQMRECLSRRFLLRLGEMEPEYAAEFAAVEDHLNFIKHLRDVYRLKVAAHNVISQEFLPPVAASLGYGDDEEAGKNLYDDFLKSTEQAGEVIDKLVKAIKV